MGIESSTDEDGSGPAFGDLFEEPPSEEQVAPDSVDLTKEKLETITRTHTKPQPFFQSKTYYKEVLAGIGEAAQRVHKGLTSFLNATDPKDRSVFRGRLTSAFWELAAAVAPTVSGTMKIPRRFLLRFGLLSPAILTADQRKMIASIILENEYDEPVHYLDEWLLKVAQGQINASAVDEVNLSRKSDDQKVVDRIDKLRGQRNAEVGLLQGKIAKGEDLETQLLEATQTVIRHDVREDLGGLKAAMNEVQKAALPRMMEILRRLNAADKEISSSYRAITEIDQQLDALKLQAEDIDTTAGVDAQTITEEFNSVRQMAKLCVGRQGNHFPVLYKQYFRPNIRDVATRENVINEIARVEALDPGLFLRTFKGQTTRILPHIIILGSYGDTGICWEPFERKNRASSRGRLAIPLFPKDLRLCVLSALADLRWQVAKEKAQHYWMEEGITGYYYMWFRDSKQKGDVKDAFLRDYILWVTREAEGTQKLEKEVRGIFWRNMPYPDEVKENLKNRGFAYAELYKKDQNRAMSDGY